MKKISVLLAVLLSVTLIFASCAPSYSWQDAENDVERLKEIGFEVYIENTQETLEELTESLNKQLARDGEDFTVEFVNVCGLVINKYEVIVFEEYATEKQAKRIYDYYRGYTIDMKYVLFGKILISTDTQEAIDLLGYDFQ